MTTPDAPASAPDRPGDAWRRDRAVEVWLVLGLSLGQSAVYSVLSIIERSTRPNQPLNQQTTSINTSVVPDRSWLDLLYQLAAIGFPLVPVALALYLLRRSGQRSEIGYDLRRPGSDVLRGLGMAALIGIPGLAFYVLARNAGFNTNVAPTNLAAQWWTVPVLVGLAVMNGVLEEVVMLGFLFARWRDLAWRPWVIVLVSALVRGSYHLYQGYGGFVGNVVMGLVFGWAYLRWKRVMPLVVAHVILDIVSFVGYALAKQYLPFL